jgi:hypothetical protein
MKGVKAVQIPVARDLKGCLEPGNVTYAFVFPYNIIICLLHKLNLSDKATVTL